MRGLAVVFESILNDTRRWSDIKRFTGVHQSIAFAQASDLARAPMKGQGMYAYSDVSKKVEVYGINPEIACRSAEFAQATYVAFGQSAVGQGTGDIPLVSDSQLREQVIPWLLRIDRDHGKKTRMGSGVTTGERQQRLSSMTSFYGTAGGSTREHFGLLCKDQLSTGSDIIWIAFRGTQTGADWKTNFDALQRVAFEPVPGKPEMPTAPEECKFARGFMRLYESTRLSILNKLDELTQSGSVPRIIITGHSLGAALATVCATDLMGMAYPVVLYTYASPRVGNVAFSAYFSDRYAHDYDAEVMSFRSWRLNQGGDPVPHIPKELSPFASNYRHIHNLWHLTWGPTPTDTLGHSMSNYIRLAYKCGFGYEVSNNDFD